MTDTARNVLETYIDNAAPRVLEDPGIGIVSFLVPRGASIETVDLEKYQDRPRRAGGFETFSEFESFVEYVDHFVDSAESAGAYVRIANDQARAVFNHHERGAPGWNDRGARWMFARTPAADTWLSHDREKMKQREFVEFLEDNREEITAPALGDLLSALRGLRVKGGATKTQSTGHYDEHGSTETSVEVTATAGDLPEKLELAIPIFRGGAVYAIEARIRIHTADGFRLSYSLVNFERAVERQIEDWRAAIANRLDLFVHR